jgi:exopolyphosphatase / guanosine-5'-triphosphate,3'-diphosphate pyrophosphatase
LRNAVIDIGTNTVKLVVGETDPAGGVRVVHESVSAPRLGEGIGAGSELSPRAIERTLQALREHVQTAGDLGATNLRLLATSATRDAVNSGEFVRRARTDLGVEIEIISGEEEGRLSFASVALDRTLGLDAGPLVIVDVGGGSTEIAVGDRDQMTGRVCVPIGAVGCTSGSC